MDEHEPKAQTILSIPVAIIVAGAFIAGAVIYTNNPKTLSPKNETPDTIVIAPITENDHIIGSPAAQIIFVEYSDTECPFCKNFQATMNRMVEKYGKDGKVAWVYRHLPITNLHPKAWNEAIATECSSYVSKNPSTFWKYIDRVYDITPSNNGLDPQKLIDTAKFVNIDSDAFTKCTDTKQTEAKVKADYDDGVQLNQGRPGTPTTAIVLQRSLEKDKVTALKNITTNAGLTDYITFSNDNQKILIKGAFPYEVLALMTDLILQ